MSPFGFGHSHATPEACRGAGLRLPGGRREVRRTSCTWRDGGAFCTDVAERSPANARPGRIGLMNRLQASPRGWRAAACERACARLRVLVLVLSAVLVGVLAALAPSASARVADAARVSGRSASAVTSSQGWAWPLAPPWRVVRPFEAPRTRYSAGHRGIDLAAGAGQDVLAPVAATVYFAGPVAGRPVITLQPADGLLVSMEPALTTLSAGDAVPRSGIVGTVATGGHCDGSCLHLGVRVNGQYVSPLIYFGGVPRAVLLPIRGR